MRARDTPRAASARVVVETPRAWNAPLARGCLALRFCASATAEDRADGTFLGNLTTGMRAARYDAVPAARGSSTRCPSAPPPRRACRAGQNSPRGAGDETSAGSRFPRLDRTLDRPVPSSARALSSHLRPEIAASRATTAVRRPRHAQPRARVHATMARPARPRPRLRRGRGRTRRRVLPRPRIARRVLRHGRRQPLRPPRRRRRRRPRPRLPRHVPPRRGPPRRPDRRPDRPARA